MICLLFMYPRLIDSFIRFHLLSQTQKHRSTIQINNSGKKKTKTKTNCRVIRNKALLFPTRVL